MYIYQRNAAITFADCCISLDQVFIQSPAGFAASMHQGLKNHKTAPKGHNPSKLNQEQRQKIALWLKDSKDSKGEPVHWILEKLRFATKKVRNLNQFDAAVEESAPHGFST